MVSSRTLSHPWSNCPLKLAITSLGAWCGACGRSRGEVSQPRLVGSNGVKHLNPGDSVVRHVVIEEIILLVVRRFDRLDALKDGGCPLTGITADEPIEVFESQACGPKVKRTGLTVLPVRHIVVLAVPRRAVAILPKHLRERADTLRHEGVVAGEACASLHDDSGIRRVMIAARQQGCAGRASKVQSCEIGCSAGRSWQAGRRSAWVSGRRTCCWLQTPHRQSE